MSESIDLNISVNPCDPLINRDLPLNALDFTMYLALPPYTHSGYCTYVACVLTTYFSIILFAYLLATYLVVAIPE
jgi:hypothetical protein